MKSTFLHKKTLLLLFAITSISFQSFSQKQIVATDSIPALEPEIQDSCEEKQYVEIGYGQIQKSDLSSATAVLGSSAFNNSVVLGASQALQGKVAGVDVTANSGSPGNSMMVRVRGISSINTSDPLYVVDGMPVGLFCTMNPAEIESVTILKDASATAIYGARGANGVILITTKGGAFGKKKKPEFHAEFNAARGVQSLSNKIDVADAQEYIAIQNQINQTINPNSAPYQWYRYSNEFYDPANIDAIAMYQDSIDAIGKGTDWQDEVFRKAAVQNYQLQLSVANSWLSISAGGTYQEQEGIVLGSDYERMNARVKAACRVGKKLVFGTSLNMGKSVSNKIDESSLWSNALALTVFADPTITPRNDSTYSEPTNNSANPLAVIEYQGRAGEDRNNMNWGEETKNNVGLNLWGEWEIVQGLTLCTRYGYTFSNIDLEHYLPEFNYGVLFQNDLSVLGTREEDRYGKNSNATLTYAKKLYSADSSSVRHEFSVMGGFERFEQKTNFYHRILKDPYSGSEELQYITASELGITGVYIPDVLFLQPDPLRSLMARGSYSFKNRYLLLATIRRDSYSKILSGGESQYFPAFSIAWKLHEEQFFRKLRMLQNVNECKLRFGWGKTGNLFASNMTNAFAFNYNDALSFVEYWELHKQANFGIDVAFFNKSLNVSADIFERNTEGMYFNIPSPDIEGVEQSTDLNNGSMKNRGLELTAMYKKQEGTFHYSAGVSYSKIKNEVEDLGAYGRISFGGSVVNIASGYNAFVTSTQVDYPIASFYGYKVDGIFQSWNEVNNSSQPNAAPGDYKYEDINKDGIIDVRDMTIIGNPHPDFTFGIHLTADYKGFDCAVDLYGAYGNDIYNAGYQVMMSNSQRNYHADKLDALNAWHNDANGDGTVSADEINGSEDVPRIDPYEYNMNSSTVSSAYVHDGSYVRVKNITFGYSLPKSIIQKAKLGGLRFYVQAQNLMTFTKYNGFDSEIGKNTSMGSAGAEFGIDRFNYPVPKSFLFGMNLAF